MRMVVLRPASRAGCALHLRADHRLSSGGNAGSTVPGRVADRRRSDFYRMVGSSPASAPRFCHFPLTAEQRSRYRRTVALFPGPSRLRLLSVQDALARARLCSI
jgi:hypothetical protein